MEISEFINNYYIIPIIAREGYNIVNTLTYALIAISAVYGIYKIFEKYKIKISRDFIINTIPFVLFGSTVRVITDSIDGGVLKPITFFHEFILNSHIYDYGFYTVSPGIYIVTAVLFLFSLALAHKMKNEKLLGYIGIALWIPHFLVLVSMIKYWEYALPILTLAGIPFYFAFRYFKDEILAGIVGAHALDGAATFFTIDVFSKITGKSYFEQHVIPSFIGETFGTFFPFYLLKIAIAFGAAWIIAKEKTDERFFVALLLIIMGLAPGLRDLMRMLAGT